MRWGLPGVLTNGGHRWARHGRGRDSFHYRAKGFREFRPEGSRRGCASPSGSAFQLLPGGRAGQPHGEPRLAGLALCLDGASVQLHDLPRDVQPEPRPAYCRSETARSKRSNTLGSRAGSMRCRGPPPPAPPSSLRGGRRLDGLPRPILDGVVQQVGDDLLEPQVVPEASHVGSASSRNRLPLCAACGSSFSVASRTSSPRSVSAFSIRSRPR